MSSLSVIFRFYSHKTIVFVLARKKRNMKNIVRDIFGISGRWLAKRRLSRNPRQFHVKGIMLLQKYSRREISLPYQ